jgi:hypothetical protein
MAFEKVFDASNGSVFKFEDVGSVLEGYYMGSFDYEGDYGPTKKHTFKTETGAVVIFGQRSLMQQLPSVKPGVMVRITYANDLPPKKKGQQPMKLFVIEQDKKNVTEVTGEADNAYEASDSQDGDPMADDAAPDEIQAQRPTAPRIPAPAASAESQKRVQDLLRNRKAA